MTKKKTKTARKITKKSVKKIEKKPIKLKESKKDKIKVPKEKRPDPEELKKIQIQKEKIEIENLNNVLQDAYARQLLVDLAGENSLEIIRNFTGDPSDEELAKKLKIKISDVRATLNRLHSAGLVKYFRDKDNETGWYSYSWNLNRNKIQDWVVGSMKSKHKQYVEKGDHYFCIECGMNSIIHFENATEMNFKCKSCNKELDFLDQEKLEQLIKWKK